MNKKLNKKPFFHFLQKPNSNHSQYSYFKSLLHYSLWLMFIFSFVFGITFVFFLKKNPNHQLIDLRGRNIVEAITWLNKHSLKVLVSEKNDINIPRYYVITQNPSPGDTVKENRTISLTVSSGKQALTMPNYSTSNFNQAYNDLFAHLSGYQTIPQITKIRRFSDIEKDLIIDQYPKFGETINLREEIIFVVSKGFTRGPVRIQNYISLKYIDVERALVSRGIRVGVNYRYTTDKKLSGTIFFQSLAAGTVINQKGKIKFTVGVFSRNEQIEKKVIEKIEILRNYQLNIPQLSNLDNFKSNIFKNEDNRKNFYASNSQSALPVINKRKVKIILTDSLGSRILINNYYYANKNINFPYKSIGNGKLEVFIDDKPFDKILLNK